MCFATSEVVELGLRCSLNLDFRDLSVSPTYVASHFSHLILYTGPTTFSLSTGSLGLTNSWRNVFIGLKYVGMPYFPNTRLICSGNPLMYGMTTGILLFLSLSDVSFTGSGLFTSPSSLLSSFNSRRIQSGHALHWAPVAPSHMFQLRWFERGVKEAIFIRALNPSLNRDGGRYNLPPVWDNIIKNRVKAERPRRGGGGGPHHHRHAQRPLTSPGRQNDEASSSW